MVDRDKTLTIRVSDEERDMLWALAERDGLSASDVLRVFIRQAYTSSFGSKKPPRSK